MQATRTTPLSELRLRQQIQFRRNLLFLTGLSLVLSASTFARFEAGGLLFQPILIPVGLLFVLNFKTRLRRVPTLILVAINAFCVAYCLVTLMHGIAPGPMAKVVMVWLIILTIATSIDSDDDARAVVIGFSVAMSILAVLALITESPEAVGVNPFGQVANDNSYSIYALPAMLLAGHFIFLQGTPRTTRIVLVVATGAMTVGIFSTANRSGYVGVFLVAVLLIALRRRVRDILIVLLLGGLLYGGVVVFGDEEVLHQELERSRSFDSTESGYSTRESIFNATRSLGFEHPIFGVGPQNLSVEIRAQYYQSFGRFENTQEVAAHNLYTALWAGGGLVLVTATLLMLYSFWMRPREWRLLGATPDRERQSRALMRALVVLFIYRGIFTEEVITTPPFALAFGLVIGMMICHHPNATNLIVETSAGTRNALLSGPISRPMRTHERRLVVVDMWKRPPSALADDG